MTTDDYVRGLGKLQGNLLSLEFSLRIFLRKKETGGALDRAADTHALKQGDVTPKTAFTNYDTLGELVDQYNASASPAHQVDRSVVDLRDTLAHGRVFGNSLAHPLRLLKFAKPIGQSVAVTYSELMDEAWFDHKVMWLSAQIDKVAEELGVTWVRFDADSDAFIRRT